MVALSPGYHDQLRSAGEAARRRRSARAPGDERHGARPRLRVGRVDPGAAGRPVAGGGSTGVTLTGVDASAGMLGAGTRQDLAAGRHASSTTTRWPSRAPSRAGSTDAVLTAYLLRNVPDRDTAPRRGAPRAAPRRRSSWCTTTRSRAAAEPSWCGPSCATGSSSRCPHVKRCDLRTAPLPVPQRPRLRLRRGDRRPAHPRGFHRGSAPLVCRMAARPRAHGRREGPGVTMRSRAPV